MSLTLKEIYDLMIAQGINKDPRGQEEIDEILNEAKKNYELLDENEKSYFDLERLHHPYSDTRILYGKENMKVKTVIAGIDVETQDLLLVERLIAKGEKIDLVIAHHPEGRALLGLHEVMSLQEDMLSDHGVPIAIAQGLMSSRMAEVRRAFLPYNVQRGVDAARLLNLPLLCVHTPADHQVQWFLEERFAQQNLKTVQDVIRSLEEIPEYQQGKKLGSGPVVVCGAKERKVGKIMVDMTGGTSGSDQIYSSLVQAGVGTIVCMHMGEAHRKEAEKNHLNVIIAGHISSDSLGMNLLLDVLSKSKIRIIPFSGLLRVER